MTQFIKIFWGFYWKYVFLCYRSLFNPEEGNIDHPHNMMEWVFIFFVIPFVVAWYAFHFARHYNDAFIERL